MQCNCYFVKMVSSQIIAQSLFHGKTILSKMKYSAYVIINLWDYYEWEAKKYKHGVNYTLKIANTASKI